VKKALPRCIPFGIGLAVAALLWATIGWWGFWLIFPWIGAGITLGLLLVLNRTGEQKDLGRRISILLAAPVFLVFLGAVERENLQLKETVFFAAAGVFSRVLIHYAVAKVFGPLLWGRGFCGWACWTAAVLDWLPIQGNRPVPRKYTFLRFPALAVSIALPFACIAAGYDYRRLHVDESLGSLHQLIWFAAGNGAYYTAAVSLAFGLGKKRASLAPAARLALLRRKPSGAACDGCGACNGHCPMDVDVAAAIRSGRAVASTECIYCGLCTAVCPRGAIARALAGSGRLARATARSGPSSRRSARRLGPGDRQRVRAAAPEIREDPLPLLGTPGLDQDPSLVDWTPQGIPYLRITTPPPRPISGRSSLGPARSGGRS
jgi:ferredoxin-type protein NapH